MLKTSFFTFLFLVSVSIFSQSKYTAKNEIEGIKYLIEYNKHNSNGKKIWGEHFLYDNTVELGTFTISQPVKIPFTEVILDKFNYKFSVLPKEHGEWEIIFTDENMKETKYSIAPFKLFNTNSETLLFYIEEPEPINGMAFIRLVGNDIQIGFYLEPIK